jgi:large subunit ribosomal protein L20
MPRVKSRVPARKRHKKVLKAARGMFGRKKSNFRLAKESVDKSRQYSYVGRKDKKQIYRSVWTVRINAAARELGLTYSKLIAGLKKAAVVLDRKVLADLAVSDSNAFGKLVAMAKAA